MPVKMWQYRCCDCGTEYHVKQREAPLKKSRCLSCHRKWQRKEAARRKYNARP